MERSRRVLIVLIMRCWSPRKYGDFVEYTYALGNPSRERSGGVSSQVTVVAFLTNSFFVEMCHQNDVWSMPSVKMHHLVDVYFLNGNLIMGNAAVVTPDRNPSGNR